MDCFEIGRSSAHNSVCPTHRIVHIDSDICSSQHGYKSDWRFQCHTAPAYMSRQMTITKHTHTRMLLFSSAGEGEAGEGEAGEGEAGEGEAGEGEAGEGEAGEGEAGEGEA